MYYLHHYFDPDFDYMNLKPKEQEDGKVDFYNLGYVQNVVRDQVIAEWRKVSPDEIEKYDERFLFKEKRFPMGRGCGVNPKNPDQLIALVNGYVYYDEEGRICVKELLNVRRNVDFHTGNIYFVNNIVVHGDIKTGFEVQGNSILVKGIVEGARVIALNSIAVEGGVKGEGRCLVRAERNIKVKYAENATLVARHSLLDEGHCLHSRVFVGKNLIIRGKAVGGKLYSQEQILIEGDLGGGMNVPTIVVLGYDPVDMYHFSSLEEKLDALNSRLTLLKVKQQKQRDEEALLSLEIQELTNKIRILSRKIARISSKIKSTEFSRCKLIVRGEIYPGVEISIGPAFYKVNDFLKGTTFSFKEDEIVLARFEKLKHRVREGFEWT